jgi:hypothetical protein
MNEVIARFMDMERTQNNDDPGFEWSWGRQLQVLIGAFMMRPRSIDHGHG